MINGSERLSLYGTGEKTCLKYESVFQSVLVGNTIIEYSHFQGRHFSFCTIGKGVALNSTNASMRNCPLFEIVSNIY